MEASKLSVANVTRNPYHPADSAPHMRTLGLSAFLVSLVVAAGCSKPHACEKPEPANLWAAASEELNPNPDGEPLPTLIRVYQLSEVGELQQASFDELMRDAEGALGDSLLATNEITVFPGRSAFQDFERDPGAKYVVGVAVVRQPSGTSWRAVLPMPMCGESSARPMVRFFVDGYSIQGTIGRENKPEGCKSDDDECLRARTKGTD